MPRADLHLSSVPLRYRYRLDGRPLAVDERATLSRTGEWSWRLHGVRLVHDLGVRLDVTAALDLAADGVSAAELRWRAPGVDVSASYRLDGDRLAVQRDGEHLERAVPPGSVLSPLLRATQGPVIAAVAARGGTTVVVPDITDPAASDRLLRPTVGVRSATVGRADARGLRPATYDGGPYPEGTALLLDGDDLLVSYALATPQGRVDVELDRALPESELVLAQE